MDLYVIPYGGVLITSVGYILNKLVRNFPCFYIQAIWGWPQDVIFQLLKDVGRGRPQDVGKKLPFALHK